MLLFICSICGHWRVLFSMADVLRESGKIGVVLCNQGCGEMTYVRLIDRLQIVPAPVVIEEREQLL